MTWAALYEPTYVMIHNMQTQWLYQPYDPQRVDSVVYKCDRRNFVFKFSGLIARLTPTPYHSQFELIGVLFQPLLLFSHDKYSTSRDNIGGFK